CAVRATESGAARTGDIQHPKPAAGIVLRAELETGSGHAGGAAVHEHQGRWRPPAGPAVACVARRVIETIDRAAAAGAELEHAAEAEILARQLARGASGNALEPAAAEPHDLGACRGPADKRGKAVGEGDRVIDAGGGFGEPAVACQPALGVADFEQRLALDQRHRADAAIAGNPIAAHAEHPLRPRQLPVTPAVQAPAAAAIPGVELPPAAVVEYKGEVATDRMPGGLEGGGAAAASHQLRPPEAAVGRNLGDVEPGRV